MAKAATLNIDIVAKADQAIEAFDKVKEKTKQAHGAMKLAALGAATAILGGLGEATKAAAEHQVEVAKLAQVYKTTGAPMEDMNKSLEDIEASSRRTGQSAEDNIAAYTNLVAATHNTAQAHSELATAQDLAAFKGISVKEAADDITRATEGNTRSLKEMGKATKDAGGHQLSTAALMKSLTSAVHGQADAFGKTAVGQTGRYKESMDQLKEKIGEGLLPVMQELLNLIAPLVGWMTKHTGVIKILALVLGGLAAVIETVAVVTKAWGAIQAIVNVIMDANPIGAIILAVVGLVAVVILVVKHWKLFEGAAKDVWNALKTFAGWIAGGFEAVWRGMQRAIDAVWGVLKILGDWVMAHWRLIIAVLLGPLGLLLGHLNDVKRAIDDVLGALKAIGRAVSDALGWLGKLPSKGGGLLGKLTGGVLSAPGGPAPTPILISITATPGSDLPETVYRALRDYQRRHVRPELAPLFGR